MNKRLETLEAQRKALDSAIRAAKDALRKRALSERRKALSAALDRAIRSGVTVAEIEALFTTEHGKTSAPSVITDNGSAGGASHV